MMESWVLIFAAFAYLIRVSSVRRLWTLPLKNGEGWFLGQRVSAGFYQGQGPAILRQYRVALVAMLFADAPVIAWLLLSWRHTMLMGEQWLAMIVSAVISNVIVLHFKFRAGSVEGIEAERGVTAVQLSMEPRRLSDHTNRWMELAIATPLLTGLGVIANAYYWGGAAPRSAVFSAVWLVYLQIGLLLLKIVFVRWRMPLPARRTEEFRRWRSAWLKYHLGVIDGMRLVFASLLLFAVAKLMQWVALPALAGLMGWVVIAYSAYCVSEKRKLNAVQAEVRPLELMQEFPRRPVASGTFFLAGLLYANRDNPDLLVRSGSGIALNMAHPTAYAWGAYLIGLAAVTLWILR